VSKVRWDGLDHKRRTALLKDTKHPTRVRDEIVPVPRAAWDIIVGMPKVDELVFPFNGDSVSAAFDRACERLKIEDLHWHDLRHEGISRLFEAGLGIEEVALISGHTSWSTLRRYTHLRPEKVLEKLEGTG
jgi:integrase